MSQLRQRPGPPLDRYIETYWWSQRVRAVDRAEHSLPTGTVSMVFALHEQPIHCEPAGALVSSLHWCRGIVHGPQWRHFKTASKPAGTTMGISFRPGMAGAILGVPVAELAGQHVAVESPWGARGNWLREQLLEATSPTAAFRILDTAFLARLTCPRTIHPAVELALEYPWPDGVPRRVADIQRATGYSPRHFIALFRAAIGLTPKHYYRIQRLSRALQGLATSRHDNLAQVASLAGYADQSHMTRDFVELAGITPTEYRPRDAHSILHHQVSRALRKARTKVKTLQDS